MKTFEKALKDEHHSVRNAVIGAFKQMGQKNPEPTFDFARKHLKDDDPKIRREIVHGIELRGRTHPEDVLPLLEELQDEEVKEVRNMVIHVIGQISYKKGCLEKVVDALNGWRNMGVCEAAEEILKVHKRYRFAARSPEYAEDYIKEHLTRCN
jgi:HEAT repeat protein